MSDSSVIELHYFLNKLYDYEPALFLKIKSYIYYPFKSNEELRRAVNIIFGRQKKNYKFYEIQMKYKLKYGHISFWDTSRITNMSKLFISIRYFNENINDWDVSNVTDMSSMFQFCGKFNQPLNKWDVSNVTNMFRMFKSCVNFKQSLNDWDISNVSDMSYMFQTCYYFSQKEKSWQIKSWDLSNVKNTNCMFKGT